MNSIFFRIYGGMLASLFLVGLLSYLLIARSNTIQTEAYRETLAKGTIHLIAAGAARTRFDERRAWLDKVESWIGEELVVMPVVDSPLTEQAEEVIHQGQVYGDMLESPSVLDLYVKIPTDEQLLIHVKMRQFSEHQARGTAKLILEELSHYPEWGWQTELERIQTYFDFPVRRVDQEQLGVDELQLNRLSRGEVVVTFVRDDSDAEVSKIEIIAQLSKVSYLLIGPLDLYGWFSFTTIFIIGAIGLATMGVVTYILVRPLQNRLKRMEGAVGRVRKGDLSGRVVVDSGDALGQLAATFNDLVEHIQRLIDSQREMTRAVSHELRTPVARIRFALEIVADLDDTAQRQRQIKEIDTDIEELDKLIDEILTYATLEEGTPSINFEMVDIDELLGNIKRETEALGTKINIEHQSTPQSKKGQEEKQLVECEARLIHRAVQNLVTNAIKYADSRVRISSAYEGGMFRVDVEDDGPGIPQDKWEKVFVPFARLDDSRTRASGGYGLGLSIVKRIAYWHGGVASVYRSRWGGAKFTVIWPMTQAQSGASTANS